MQKKYKIRCRNKGILVTSTPEIYDVVWKRIFNPEIYPMDRLNITNQLTPNQCPNTPKPST